MSNQNTYILYIYVFLQVDQKETLLKKQPGQVQAYLQNETSTTGSDASCFTSVMTSQFRLVDRALSEPTNTRNSLYKHRRIADRSC